MDASRLFVDTCHELEQRLVENTPHSILRTSLPLRQLILDDSPLVLQLRRTHRAVPVEFTVDVSAIDWDTVGFPAPDVEFLLDQALGPLPPMFKRITLDLERFLKLRFARVEQKTFTVKEVIEFMAYVEGGIHLGRAPDDEQKRLEEIGKFFQLDNLSLVYVAMRGIATAALRAMRPMLDAVLKTGAP